MHNPTAQPQWVIDQVLEIDRHFPGFCGAFLRASAEKRQVMAMYLASIDAGSPGDFADIETARWLVSSKHDVILAEAHGEPLVGLRGALRRAGPIVHDKRFYIVLRGMLARPKHGAIASCINRLDVIDLTRLRVVNILPQEICRANVVEAVGDVSTACRLAVAMKLLTSAGAEEKALIEAVRRVRDEIALRNAIRRAMLLCTAPDHPIQSTDAYRPIRSPKELHQVAAKFRNCARGYAVELLDQEAPHAFATFRLHKEEAIIHLRQKTGQWCLEGIFGPRNSRPSGDLRERAEDLLRQHGILIQDRSGRNTEWDAVRHFATHPFFEVDYA